MFCKWLQESENLRRQMLLHNHLKSRRNTPAKMYNQQPFDILEISRPNSNSDDEEFLDTEADNQSVWSPAQSFIPVIIDSSRLPTPTPSLNSNSGSSSKTLHSITNSNVIPVSSANLLNVNDLSRNSSSSDVTINSSQCGSVISGSSITKPIKKTPLHNKGKAPAIPTTVTSETDEKFNIELETSVNSDEHKDPVNDKDKKKKGILNYIPSIFKPLSPSSSTHNVLNSNSAQQQPETEEQRLETEI